MKEFKGKLDEGPVKRLPTLAMVGGCCLMFTIKEEVSSSLAQRATFSFKGGLGVGDVLDSRGLESCAMLQRAEPMTCRAQVLPSEVRGARVTTRPHESTPCGPPHGHGVLDCPGQLRHLLLLGLVDLQAVSTQLQQLRLVFLML